MWLTGTLKDVIRQLAEILILWVLFYHGLKAVRGTRTSIVVKVLLFMLIVWYVAFRFGFETIHWLVTISFLPVTLALVVLYAPELRRTVSQMGQIRFLTRGGASKSALVSELLRAARTMSSRHIGALIVFERQNSLQGFIDTGISIDSHVSAELLISIFSNKSPLHDGAVVIKGERLLAASCLLPLTQRSDADESYGTRHRAAIGLTEETDAVVLVISEETGAVSVVVNGQMTRDLDYPTLERVLTNLLGLD